jgi:aminocarboxymuconate-semialdehyde decarboxylase
VDAITGVGFLVPVQRKASGACIGRSPASRGDRLKIRSRVAFGPRERSANVPGSDDLTLVRPYGATAARTHARPGRDLRPRSTTIDIHSHVSVPAAHALVEPHLDISTIPLTFFSSTQSKIVNARQELDRRTRMSGAENGLSERLRDLDAAGVDLQLVMPPPPQCYYTVPIEIAVKAMQIINDGLAAYVARAPDRFVALGGVPLQDATAAANELERSMRSLGFRGVEILTNVAGKELSDASLEPFWIKAEELGALVVIHPNGFTEGTRLSRFYFNNIIGNPMETTIALHYLIFDGVLARHPDLKVLAAHGGGYLGSYPGRIDHAWGARDDCRADLPLPPSHYLKKVFVDSVVFTPLQLEALVKVFGVDHVLMGTDYPFDMAEADPIGHVTAGEPFDAGTVAAIAGNNAKRLLGI